MRTFRVKAFFWVEADNENEAEEIVSENLLLITKDKKKARVREGSAKLHFTEDTRS